jgi:prenyltransferase beta subunit
MMEIISGNNESKATNNRKKKQKSENDQTFVGNVTIKQYTTHKKSFYFLEQLILKHKLHKKFKMEMEEINLGLKFNFVNNDCSKFVDFIKNFLPIYQRKVKNIENQSIFKTEISPICRCILFY